MTGKEMWLIYARTHREFDVEADLRALGIDVWCGRVLEGKPDPKRAGRKRLTLWSERPAIPNYIFASLEPGEYHDAKAIRDVVGFVSVVEPCAMRGVQQFMRVVDADYEEKRRAKERGEEAPPAFDAGQVLEAVGGPLSGLMLRYRRVIEDVDGYAVEADSPLGVVRMNPGDVKAAE